METLLFAALSVSQSAAGSHFASPSTKAPASALPSAWSPAPLPMASPPSKATARRLPGAKAASSVTGMTTAAAALCEPSPESSTSSSSSSCQNQCQEVAGTVASPAASSRGSVPAGFAGAPGPNTACPPEAGLTAPPRDAMRQGTPKSTMMPQKRMRPPMLASRMVPVPAMAVPGLGGGGGSTKTSTGSGANDTGLALTGPLVTLSTPGTPLTPAAMSLAMDSMAATIASNANADRMPCEGPTSVWTSAAAPSEAGANLTLICSGLTEGGRFLSKASVIAPPISLCMSSSSMSSA
mmetsp:Transcript_23278/g.69925  ORF Transcript_23278/g.69925 Transcript_23278/m.69925 type:complete len:295 (-) Transcript_23278:919-1803(-)